jgi:hypothetical protein
LIDEQGRADFDDDAAKRGEGGRDCHGSFTVLGG